MYCKEHNINPAYEDFLADIREHISDADLADDYNFQYMNGINSEPEIIPTNTMADDVTGIGMNGGAYQGGLNLGLTQSKIDEILNIPKGSRPDPSTYLSQEFIDAHLSQFDDGVSVIQTEWAYSRYSETNGFVGVPDDNTLFVIPKKYCDDVIARANGDISIIERELGYPEEYFSDGGGLVRIDAANTSDLNLRIPSGNETGANQLWIPGGETSGGVPEAITNTISLNDTTITRIEVN